MKVTIRKKEHESDNQKIICVEDGMKSEREVKRDRCEKNISFKYSTSQGSN